MEDGNPCGGKEMEFIIPEGWFIEDHGIWAYIWSPPPDADAAAVEFLKRHA